MTPVTADKLVRLGEEKSTRLIVAVDELSGGLTLEHTTKLLAHLKELAAGVKVGLPLLLNLGLSQVSALIEKFQGSFYFLADFKLADVPSIVRKELELIRKAGFDGAIVHLFPMGYEDELPSIASTGLDVYGLVAMSHPKSKLVDQHFEDLVRYSAELNLSGVVVPATKPALIERARSYLPRKYLILSPGVGVQGAEPGAALRHGADFEIVGRMVTTSPNPREVAESIVSAERRWLR